MSPDEPPDRAAGLYRHWSGLHDEAAARGYLHTAVVNGSREVPRRRPRLRAPTSGLPTWALLALAGLLGALASVLAGVISAGPG